MKIFLTNQIVLFPIGQRITEASITQARYLLESFIITNEFHISEMPSVPLLDLLLEHEEVF